MVIVIAFAVLCSGCSDPDSSPRESAEGASDQQTIVATVPPLGMILAELTKGRASVEVLLAPGASPHTYEPTPSDVRATSNSLMLVHAHDNLDGWVASLPAERTLELAPLVPSEQRLSMPSSGKEDASSPSKESHTNMSDPENTGSAEHRSQESDSQDGDFDPHFWTSPVVVQSILPSLVDSLCAADSEGCAMYRKNGKALITDLEVLHGRIASMLRPVEGTTVALSQPFFQYFLNEYGFPVAAVIEPHPGKEPSSKRIRQLIQTVRERGASVIFTQTQLPGRSARVISVETGIPTRDLDPLGGREGRAAYTDFMMHNAREVSSALGPADSEPAPGSSR
jgi:zinc transport system substrate-binding protein